jgi:uncharacterized protein DUF7008/Eco57I restriction-modification methylase
MARAKKSKTKLSELEGQPDPRAAIDSAALLSACQGVLARLEADLLERTKASPAVTQALEARYQAEKAAERTAESFAGWTALLATQVAAAWVLSCVFVRTLEDRGLLKQARLAGPGAEDSQRQFFQLAPSLTERDYLLTVFRELAHHPAAKDLFDAKHSPVWKLSPSAAAAKELLALFRLPNATTPAFRFGQASTRFLGDLYQDISEDVRKRYALLQTPDFIESFILDRTLDPAIQRFGLDDTTLIDPTCGSGHFLLGAFDRLFEHRLRAEPGVDVRIAAVKALDCVYGADINPYAVAIARFRLTLSFLEKAGYTKLADAPALPLHLVVADSLRINAQLPQGELWHQEGVSTQGWLGDVFSLEDEKAAKDVLFRQYAAVVGNPPYITVKDAAMREVYRKMYVAAAGKYALSAPFCERFFQLARPRGYTGQITANSFMKREFGTRLVKEVLPAVNLEFIVNMSGAYVPGHGTPTVLLFGAHEPPQGTEVLAVLAKRGEPSTPDDPSQGLVWRSIAEHFSMVDFENDYISIARVAREVLAKHPWSLGGGGASELKELLEERGEKCLGEIADSIGISCVTGEDDVFLLPSDVARRQRVGRTRPLVTGEFVRDWSAQAAGEVLFPYDANLCTLPADEVAAELRYLWPYRAVISKRKRFGVPMLEKGLAWYELQELYSDKLRTPLTIAFAFVATHNHFTLDRGGHVFNRSAPIIKLAEGATDDDHFALLAYLNSSTAAFFFRQAGHNKGAQGVNEGHKSEQWEQFLEYSGALVDSVPLPPQLEELCTLGRRGDTLARELLTLRPQTVERSYEDDSELNDAVVRAERRARDLLCELVAVQEKIDWATYRLFGLIAREPRLPDSIAPGCRPFEYELRRTSPGSIWFERNGYPLPSAPEGIEPALVLIAGSREIALMEQPEYKHRWTMPRYTEEIAVTKHQRWLSVIEARMRTAATVTQRREAAEFLRGTPLDEMTVNSLLESQCIPFLAVMRFSSTGLERHEQWLTCWDAQRREDSGQPMQLAAPRRYQSVDYSSVLCWQLRGKLDVPRERFISYPGCESDNDGEPVYGWAGWDHLQRAKALASLYLDRKDREGWTADRLTPMLAGLLELIPWVKQWHNEPSDEFGGLRMGDYYEQFLDGECRLHGLTHDDLRAWRPTKKTRGGGKAAAKARADKAEEAATNGNGHAEGEPTAATARNPRAKKPPAAAKTRPAGEEAE